MGDDGVGACACVTKLMYFNNIFNVIKSPMVFSPLFSLLGL